MRLGSAFSDSLVIEKHVASRMKVRRRAWWLGAGRALLFTLILLVSFFVLMIRMLDLTIIQGHRMRALADENRMRELIRHAPRGLLLDRTGKPLVENIPQYRLLRPCAEESDKRCSERLTKEEGEELLSKGLPNSHFLEVDYQRVYLYPEITSHVLGFTGELTGEELEDEYYQLRKYRLGDKVGRNGAEAVYEEKLRGRDGKELVEVDATGKILRTLGRDEETAGQDIMLSIDIELTKAASDAFPKGSKGAVVVTKPQTGEILAMYSSPTFSLNRFTSGMPQEEYEALTTSTDKPMFNRAIGGVYPPGSTFKLVTSLAALEEKVIDGSSTVEDTGVIRIDQYTFPNWYFLQYGRTDGIVDVEKALARSNDIFFYKVGEALGITRLSAWARKVGVGKPLGIELSGEAGGLMPDPEWKKLNFTSEADREARQNIWYLGDTYHVSIGQGYLLTTPLQVAAWTDIVANGGKLCRPTIKKIDYRLSSPECIDLEVSQSSLELIRKGMERACSDGGTGWPLFNFSVKLSSTSAALLGEKNSENPVAASESAKLYVPVACKTGTAEYGDSQDNTHAWFTSFAPVPSEDNNTYPANVRRDDPELSVVVLVEGAGEGSEKAAPIAKKVFEAWFSRQ